MVIGIILYFYASRSITGNIRNTLSQSCRQIQMRTEQSMRLQERHLLLFISGEEVSEFMHLSPPMYSYFQLFSRITKNMNQMLIYDLGIESGVLVNFQHDWIISSNALQPVSEITAEPYLRNVLQNMTNDRWFVDFTPKENPPSLSLNWLKPNTIKCIYPFPVRGPPIGFASVSIPCSWYAGILASDSYALDILVIDKQGRIVISKEEKYRGLHAADSLYGEDLGDLIGGGLAEEGFITGSRNRLMYSLIRSPYTGWTYVYIADMKNVMGELSVLMNITLGMGAAIMIGVIIFAFFRARFFYRPVNRLYTRLVAGEKGHESLNGSITTKDEFESIDSRLDAILKDKRNLEQRLLRESRLGKELFVHNLLNGEIPDEILINEKLELYHLPRCPPFCRVALMQFDPPEDSGYEQSDHDWLFIALSGIAGEIVADFLCLPIVVDGGSIAMILGTETDQGEFREQLARRFERLLEEARKTINVDGEICISANMTSYTMVSECRAQANEMFKYQLRYSQNSILFMEDMEESPVVYPQFPQWLEENILNAIRRGDNFETDAALEKFIRYTLENDKIRQWYNLTFSRLLVDIMRLCHEYNLDQHLSGLKRIEFEQLFTLKNWKSIYDWFKEKYTDPLLHLIHQSVVQKEAALIDRMKKIAETRYHEYLSVENIGKELSMSATFLRLVFKQGTGMAFNTYLTKCRIEAAKKMLRETDMLLSDIAKKITYQNAQNFIRTFRRETGITPGEYRSSISSLDRGEP
jgi:AraC-like DNA-binding protein